MKFSRLMSFVLTIMIHIGCGPTEEEPKVEELQALFADSDGKLADCAALQTQAKENLASELHDVADALRAGQDSLTATAELGDSDADFEQADRVCGRLYRTLERRREEKDLDPLLFYLLWIGRTEWHPR